MDKAEPDYIREVLGEDYVIQKEDTTARLFLGLSIPDDAVDSLLSVAEASFPQYIERTTPKENFHMTLLFLGEVKNHQQYLGRLQQPMRLAFVPTVSVTYVGRGKNRDQLWAYINPTSNLQTVRSELRERLRSMRFPLQPDNKPFIPHIRLASFYPMARSLGIADVPAPLTFTTSEAYLYKSVLEEGKPPKYTVETTIPL